MSENFNYTDTDNIRIKIDCDYCRNANTCDELSHDNDLSFMSCGSTEKGIRMMFQSGDKRLTQLIVEELTPYGFKFDNLKWKLIATFTPNYCPFCGRPLVENIIQRRNKNE